MSRPLVPGAGGAALVAVAAALWGTDALFRRGLALDLPPVEVVFWEHVLLALAALPLVRHAAGRVRALVRRDWLALAFVGGGSSVAATVLFTEAFRHGDPNTPLLLQKLQPVIAAGAACALLGERLRPRYVAFMVAALAGSYLVTFADPREVGADRLTAAGLGAGAALLWALGTVLGKHVSGRLSPGELTGLRFMLGLPVAAVLLVALEGAELEATAGDAGSLTALALVPGLLALLLYYRGLARTTASVATLAELAFPVSAIAVNAIAFDARLTVTQWIGALGLAATVVALGRADRRGAEAVGVRTRRRPALEPAYGGSGA